MSTAILPKSARPVKPSSKPARTMRVLARFASGLVLSVTEGKTTTTYQVARLDGDLGPAFRWEKADGGEVYDVLLGDLDTAPSCECKGHIRWGHKTVCKHLAATRALLAC